jgi:hypothetical protein
MRHFQPYHRNAAAVAGESFFNSFGYGFGKNEQFAQIFVPKVKKVVGFVFWHNQYMALHQWEYIQKCKKLVIFCYFVRGYLPGNYFTKYGHMVYVWRLSFFYQEVGFALF